MKLNQGQRQPASAAIIELAPEQARLKKAQ